MDGWCVRGYPDDVSLPGLDCSRGSYPARSPTARRARRTQLLVGMTSCCRGQSLQVLCPHAQEMLKANVFSRLGLDYDPVRLAFGLFIDGRVSNSFACSI